MGTITLDRKRLTQPQKDHISEILPSVGAGVLDDLIFVIEHAWSLDPIKYDKNELTPGKVYGHLEAIRKNLENSLDKLDKLEGLNNLDERDKLVKLHKGGGWANRIDMRYSVTNENTLLHSLENFFPYRSGTEMMLLTIMLAIEDLQKDIKPKVKRGDHRADRYAYLITDVAQFFEKYIPDHKPSADKDSPFYKLISYIFRKVLNTATQDPKRHIVYALKPR